MSLRCLQLHYAYTVVYIYIYIGSCIICLVDQSELVTVIGKGLAVL